MPTEVNPFVFNSSQKLHFFFLTGFSVSMACLVCGTGIKWCMLTNVIWLVCRTIMMELHGQPSACAAKRRKEMIEEESVERGTWISSARLWQRGIYAHKHLVDWIVLAKSPLCSGFDGACATFFSLQYTHSSLKNKRLWLFPHYIFFLIIYQDDPSGCYIYRTGNVAYFIDR